MKTKFPFDELNVLEEYLKRLTSSKGQSLKENSGVFNADDIDDVIEDLLILAYQDGVSAVSEMLGFDIEPDVAHAKESVFKPIAGKTFEQRVSEYASSGTVADIMRVAETEAHRVYNEAAMNAAKKAGAKTKTWVTMMDEKVRDTHDYLENMTVSIDEPFFTYDGDSAQHPGGFISPENNINCRCELLFSR